MSRARQAAYSTNDDQGISNLHAQTAARFADQDAARMKELDRIIESGSHCRYCGRRLADETMGKHPGICATSICKRRAKSAALYGKKGKR
jgi:hypothetical protein